MLMITATEGNKSNLSSASFFSFAHKKGYASCYHINLHSTNNCLTCLHLSTNSLRPVKSNSFIYIFTSLATQALGSLS